MPSTAPPASDVSAASALAVPQSAWTARLAELGSIVLVAAQLGLLLLTFYVFDLERGGFVRLAPLIFGGFIVTQRMLQMFRQKR